MFDLTVSMGNILQIIAMLIGGLAFLWRVESRVLILSNRLENIYREKDQQHRSNTDKFISIEMELKQLISVTVEQAKISERLNGFEQRINMISQRLDEGLRKLTNGIHRRSKG